jgi:hypothetical protein
MRNIVMTVAVATLVTFAAFAGRPTVAAEAPAAVSKVRIGVYDTRAVALAWGRSKAFNGHLAEVRAEYDAAKKAGDEKHLKEIDDRMRNAQDKMHWQVFSDWNINDILEVIKPNYAEIARKAGVVALVPKVSFADDSVEAVDVTMAMVEQFAPDQKTVQMMKEMAKHAPLPLEEMKQVRPED